MKVSTFMFGGVRASVYTLAIGEKIGKHRHDLDHSTGVVQGATKVVIDGQPPVYMRAGDNRVLPKNIDHEITATAANTMVLNMISGDAKQFDPLPGALPVTAPVRLVSR